MIYNNRSLLDTYSVLDMHYVNLYNQSFANTIMISIFTDEETQS